MFLLPASTWEATVAFQRVTKATVVLSTRQKLPVQAWPALWEFLPATQWFLVLPVRLAAVRGAGGGAGEAARPSALTRPVCTCTGLAQLPPGHPSVPQRVYRTPESQICRHHEVPTQPSDRGLGTSEWKCQIIYPEML